MLPVALPAALPAQLGAHLTVFADWLADRPGQRWRPACPAEVVRVTKDLLHHGRHRQVLDSDTSAQRRRLMAAAALISRRIPRAKPRANDRRRQGKPGHSQRWSPQL